VLGVVAQAASTKVATAARARDRVLRIVELLQGLGV
jgi:hypothetical protein